MTGDVQGLIEVFEGAAARVGGRARLRITPPEETRAPGFVVELEPVDRPAAEMWALIAGPDDVEIGIGKALRADLQYHRAPERVEADLREIVRAVVEGDVVETVWRRAGRVVRAKGTIVLHGKPSTLRYRDAAASLTLGRTEKQTYDYVPY